MCTQTLEEPVMSLLMRFCLCPVVLLAAMTGAASARAKSDGAPPRLALVSTTLTPAIQNILTLAEAKISTDSAVQLVDRREIDKILAEQKLSTAGFVKEDQVLKVGRLLGVNLFAVLEAAPNSKEVVGLVIFDAATGTRVWDAAVPQDSLDAMTAGVKKAVQGAAAKYQKLDKGLRTVCVTTVRNSGLPPSKDAICETIGFFLERNFVSSPSLALLERTRLDHVIKEKNLATDSRLKGLLASLVRVELEVGRGTDGKGIGATALLFDGQGKKLARASVNVASENAADVAQALQANVLKLLEAAPADSAPDRAKEAIRFAQEAAFWVFHGDRARARLSLNAAVALDPPNRDLHRQLITLYSQSAQQILFRMPTDEEVMQSLRLMRRAMQEMLLFEAAWQANPNGAEISPLGFYAKDYLKDLSRVVKSPSPQARELMEEIGTSLAQWTDARLENLMAKVRDRKTFSSALSILTGPPSPWLAKRPPALPPQLKSVWRKHLTRFFELAQEFGTAPLTPDQVERIYIVIRSAAYDDVSPPLLKDYRDALKRSKSPYVTLYDRLVELQVQLDRDKPSRSEQQKSITAYRLFVQELLASDPARESQRVRWHGYHSFKNLFREGVGLFFDDYADPFGKEVCALADFMIERKDIHPEIAVLAVQGVANVRKRANAERAFDFTARLLALLDSSDSHFLSDVVNAKDVNAKDALKSTLNGRQQSLANFFPDLVVRSSPWVQLDNLIDVSGSRKGIVRLNKPIVHEKAVYVVLCGQQTSPADRFLQLCRFTLADGKKTLLGKITVDTGYKPLPALESDRLPKMGGSSLFVVDGLIHEGRYYVATRDKGVFIFPLDGAKVEHLHTGNGLPSDHVHSLACVDGVLFAGLGQFLKPAFIIAHDLKSGQSKILASSSRVDVRSPFDNSSPFTVLHLCADPLRHRVLAFVGGYSQAKADLNGLWEIDAKQGHFRQLYADHHLYWMSPPFAGKVLLATRQTTLFDLKSDQVNSIDVTGGSGRYPFVQSRLDTIRNLVKAGPPLQQLCEGHFIHDGWLWSSSAFGRLSFDRKKRELFASPRQKSKAPFYPYECFQLVGDNQVLMADAHGMWLATLAEGRK
jgi:hypothetical protein